MTRILELAPTGHRPCAAQEVRCEPTSPQPTQGYGACSISGCPCKNYQQAYGTDLCGNCGHNYTDHW